MGTVSLSLAEGQQHLRDGAVRLKDGWRTSFRGTVAGNGSAVIFGW